MLEAAGLPAPALVNGVTQEPMHGTSMIYSFDAADAPEQHQTQYFEMMGNRGIYHKGWSAVTLHKVPWLSVQEMGNPQFDDDKWELYDRSADWSQAKDLSADHPDKLHELQRLFLIEATRFNVLPLDDRSGERFNPEIAGRPQLISGTSQVLFRGMKRLSENSVISVKNKSFTVTAEITAPEADAAGVLIAQGGAFGGWSLFVTEGKPAFCYNAYGIKEFNIVGESALPGGTHQVRAEFAYEGGGLGKGGTVTLYVDGEAAGSGHVEATEPFTFSMDETCDVGVDTATRVSSLYANGPSNAFTGEVDWVRIDTGDDDHSHLINPEDLLQVAMTHQ